MQLPGILPSTPVHIHQLSLVFTGHFFLFSRGCSLRIPTAFIGEKSSPRTGRWEGRRAAVWNPNNCSLFFTHAVLTGQTPMEGGKERMPLTAVYSKMFKVQKSKGACLGMNVGRFFFLQMSLVLVKGLWITAQDPKCDKSAESYRKGRASTSLALTELHLQVKEEPSSLCITFFIYGKHCINPQWPSAQRHIYQEEKRKLQPRAYSSFTVACARRHQRKPS